MNRSTIYDTENGKVKRMLFDGAGVPGWHYFLCDHAGSVRVVAELPDRASSLCSRGLNAVIPPDSVAQAEVSDRNLHEARLMIP